MKKDSFLFKNTDEYIFLSEKNIKEMQITSLYNLVIITMKERQSQLIKDVNNKVSLKINNVDIVSELTKSLDKIHELYPDLIISARKTLDISLN